MITDSLRYTDTTTIRVQQTGMSLTCLRFVVCMSRSLQKRISISHKICFPILILCLFENAILCNLI